MTRRAHSHVQKVTIRRLKILAATTIWCGLGATASATADQGFVAAGIVALPAYEGADETRVYPLLIGEFRFGGRAIAFDGLALKADLIPDPDGWDLDAGPLAAIRFGREGADDPVIALLPEVDDAAELGGFFRIARRGVFASNDALGIETDLRADIANAHDGATASVSAVYEWSLGRRWRMAARTGAVFADGDYMRAFFGVDAAASSASGLAAYAPEGGLKNLSTSLSATYAVTDRWSLTGLVIWDRFAGDAADSPIITGPGSERQLGAGLALGRAF